MFRKHFALRAAAGAFLVVGACRGADDVAGPAVSPDLNVRQTSSAPSQDELDRSVPGFGGFYVDQTGTPTVYLQAGASRRQAERALDGFLTARGMGPERLRVVPAQYAYRQLETWYMRATPGALDIDGAVFVDNDESSNRVRIGVADLNAYALVRQTLLRLGIPEGAAIVEHADPIIQLASLQNVVDRPVRAGVQINFPGFLCSVGFNATSGTQKSFITASHCTNTQGGTESTPYWQPLQSSQPTQIATEVDDPVYQKGLPGCPKGKNCRYSDASRAAYINGANQALGLIAKTSAPNNGSLEITGSFTITADDLRDHFTVGDVINKVGRTTGWTQGPVTNTCVNTGVQGSRIVQLCQTFVTSSSVIVGGGDSGSDVFEITSGTNVTLAGVLWGGNGSGTQFVFSPLKNVIAELGPLTTH
ncbi:MAG TPA: hypothetical protein VFU23_11615 [Gemmatimonadales bacterium]|nr:hypothetical protein [Gemmatimonadales bacterium]